ncbi:MAG: hypothetical protein ABSB31_05235 [Dehalococcoidia bacterium]
MSLTGWQRGFQGLGLAVLLMAAIAATMTFSFWVCRAGPFCAGKDSETINPTRFHAVNNPGASTFPTAGSENYSSSVTQILNKLKNSTDTPSQ